MLSSHAPAVRMPDCGRTLPVPVNPPDPVTGVDPPEMTGALLAPVVPAEPVGPPEPDATPPATGKPGAAPGGGAEPVMLVPAGTGAEAVEPLGVPVPASSPSPVLDELPGSPAAEECATLSVGVAPPGS